MIMENKENRENTFNQKNTSIFLPLIKKKKRTNKKKVKTICIYPLKEPSFFKYASILNKKGREI